MNSGMHSHTRFATPLVFVLAFALASALIAGCSDGDRLVLGRKPLADAGPRAQTDGSQSFGNAGSESPPPTQTGGGAGLEAWIEHERAATQVVAVGCDGECVEVQAAARGGFPPYAFVWEDGSTGATRKLCAEQTAKFTVAVTDSGLASGEFMRPPRTVTSTITAEVRACSDGGGGPALSDAGGDAAIGGDGGPQDGGEPGGACTIEPQRAPRCVELTFEPCSVASSMLFAKLPQPIQPGESACIWFAIADPQGGLLPFGGYDLSTGPTTCVNESPIGGFLTPLGALLFEAHGGLCPGGSSEPLEWIGLEPTFGFVGNPQFVHARLCDVCPYER